MWCAPAAGPPWQWMRCCAGLAICAAGSRCHCSTTGSICAQQKAAFMWSLGPRLRRSASGPGWASRLAPVAACALRGVHTPRCRLHLRHVDARERRRIHFARARTATGGVRGGILTPRIDKGPDGAGPRCVMCRNHRQARRKFRAHVWHRNGARNSYARTAASPSRRASALRSAVSVQLPDGTHRSRWYLRLNPILDHQR